MSLELHFHGDTKLIEVHGTGSDIDVSVQGDIYSDWKTWVQSGSNSKYLSALRTIGGDPTVGTKTVAPYFFLMNGWKFRPDINNNCTINLIGNLFVDEPETYGTNVFTPPTGSYTVLVNMSTTSDASVLTAETQLSESDKTAIAEESASKTQGKLLPFLV